MMVSSVIAEKYVCEHPETSLTRNAIRCLLRSGVIPSVHAGNRRFYPYERFCEFLENGNDPAENDGYGKIRRIV